MICINGTGSKMFMIENILYKWYISRYKDRYGKKIFAVCPEIEVISVFQITTSLNRVGESLNYVVKVAFKETASPSTHCCRSTRHKHQPALMAVHLYTFLLFLPEERRHSAFQMFLDQMWNFTILEKKKNQTSRYTCKEFKAFSLYQINHHPLHQECSDLWKAWALSHGFAFALCSFLRKAVVWSLNQERLN